jgi:hypothetical protein
MGLSNKQLQQIADGYAVFKRLLDQVLADMRQLQLQQPCNGSSNSGSSSQAHGARCCGVSTMDSYADMADVCSPTGGAAAAATAAASSTFAMLSVEGYAMHR